MKTSLNYFVAVIAMVFTFASCSSDDNNTTNPTNELDGLVKIQQFDNDSHTIELYSKNGLLQQGYNDINIRIKDKQSAAYVKNATITWKPLMHMTMMTHACPYSALTKTNAAGTLYNGFIVFTMPQNTTEYWDLEINYIIDGVNYTAISQIDVPASAKRTLNTFTGTDGTKYVVAYIEPTAPKVAVNDLKVGVWKMENMMNFPMVNGYTVKIDPRMPSMGNHTSPNNVNAVQANPGELYTGKLSLTMTGYWKINLQLANTSGEILKGETVTDAVEASSIFFEIEF
ncbi:hypothetical protein [Flavobacterium antarcticum]|uniref:hypothetical protein n=1 Tax=Flavobacterium antarcticum TaxID=271155 RepID=UPI0003B73206|nr:hypothetical protein [Flavobacterium antarcticum]